MEKVVLVAEDDEIIYESIESSLAREGIRTIHSVEGSKALELFFKNPVPVILTDLRMPGMSGNELVDRLLALHPRPIIIIQSVVDDIQLIINFMRRGVFDYIIKPYSLQELTIRVKKAFEMYELLEYKIKHQSFRESITKEDSPVIQLEKFDSLIKKILNEYHNPENGLHLEEKTYLQLKEQYDASKIILWEVERLGFYDKIPNENNRIPAYNIKYTIEGVIAKLEKYLKIKNQQITLSLDESSLSSHSILVDTESFFTVLVELILNAIKFGKDSSTIKIFVEINFNRLEIIIENQIPENHYLPSTLDLLFEPFYRTHIENEKNFPTSNIGFGLTLVRKIIANHRGTIKISLKDESGQDKNIQILVFLPLVD